jgi:nucleotidyltransferase-like protein
VTVVAQRAAVWAPGVRLILFGSRAVGTAGLSSDYDIFFIFPNQTADWQRPQSIGSVSSLAIARGIGLSVESASDEEWLSPPEVRPLIERVKAKGIEVPWPEADVLWQLREIGGRVPVVADVDEQRSDPQA